MNNNLPTLSIGMPVFNGAEFIGEAIDSILAQTYRNFELIISDNASTDNTFDICKQYARCDSRIRLLRQDVNRGAAANFNLVFQEGRGRFFKWAAADDICLPDFLESCIDFLEENPDTILCYPQTKTFGGQSRQKPFPGAHKLTDPSILCRVGGALSWAPVADYVFGVMRADVLKSTNLIGPYPSSDRVLILELTLRGQFHEVPKVMFMRRVHTQQSIRAYRSKREMAVCFYDPMRKHGCGKRFPEWLLVAEYAKAILRAPVSPSIRIRCLFLLHHWFQCRWRPLAKELLSIAFHELGRDVLDRK